MNDLTISNATPAPAPAPAPAASSATACFGVILDVNGSAVPVSTTDISNVKKNGAEFTLQTPIALGSIDKFEKWAQDKFNVSLPTAADFPPPLNTVVGAITGMEITVEYAHIKIPPATTTTPDPAVAYTLQVNGQLPDEISLIPNVLGIAGFVFGVSNETPAS
ncbi:hypothetical protein Jab_2c14060 [Janthinobacterium sp. HH01]|uniref:hypothetical protein n=1 Tax=Janthinobacterium sp. HH01 TaxID=1198452 RepID=UPI0002AEB0FB|nr:hypothetical protein [Janthinobacterium sp. HH01]ELX09340.1 hypothetical protein Jab_2c14060 [Janthinobacterium sp. HH01]